MAWTKMKTAVVAGACVLFATGTTLVTMKHIRHYKADLIARKVTGQPPQKESDLKDQLPGTWELVATRSGGPNGLRYYPTNNGHYKIFTPTGWKIVTYDSQSNVVYSAGGPYALHGNVYMETVESATGAMTQFLGAHPRFKIRIEGNTYYQLGVGGNAWVQEIWQRVQE
jgi:hypothetical protein